jgi:hypothetical protein
MIAFMSDYGRTLDTRNGVWLAETKSTCDIIFFVFYVNLLGKDQLLEFATQLAKAGQMKFVFMFSPIIFLTWDCYTNGECKKEW